MSIRSAAAQYADGASVTVEENGETVALLLHGLGGDRHQPLALLRERPVPAMTIVAPDQRAHGNTDEIGTAADFEIDHLADDAEALLTSLGLDRRPLIVVGISMGAAVALKLLQRDEHDLRGGLLIRPAFNTEAWPEHLRVFAEIAKLLRASGEDGLTEFVSSPQYRRVEEVSPACARSLREQFTKSRSAERVVRLENVPANASITWSGTWEPPCPITVVGADSDPVHPWETALLWHEKIAGSDLVRIPSRDMFPDAYERSLTDVAANRLPYWAS